MTVTLDLALTDPRSPDRGDILCTARRVHRIVDARPVESTKWGNRWRLTLEPVGIARNGTPEDPGLAAHVDWRSRRYRDGETPESHFGTEAA